MDVPDPGRSSARSAPARCRCGGSVLRNGDRDPGAVDDRLGVLISACLQQEEAAPWCHPRRDPDPDHPPRGAEAGHSSPGENRGAGEKNEARRPRDSQWRRPKPQPPRAAALTAQAPPPAPDPTQRILAPVGASARKTPLPRNARREPCPCDGQELMQQSIEMARLAAEIERSRSCTRSGQAQVISASTQQYEYAAYMRAAGREGRTLGNLNYPRRRDGRA